ncbi:MAG: acyl-CoA thioesterase [Deltaproteobacteria bacterium]|nr:acyl-CoA thioesterase [Deltaproteobacteria bacterium]
MIQNIVERKIMWGDLDSLGIVFYPRYYVWFDNSGHLFFETIGLSLGTLWSERKILFGLVETSCRYIKPARYHQQIRITTGIDKLGEKTITLKHSLQSLPDATLLAEGFEHRICLDVSDPVNLRAISIPDDIHAMLKKAQEG